MTIDNIYLVSRDAQGQFKYEKVCHTKIDRTRAMDCCFGEKFDRSRIDHIHPTDRRFEVRLDQEDETDEILVEELYLFANRNDAQDFLAEGWRGRIHEDPQGFCWHTIRKHFAEMEVATLAEEL